MIVGFDAKRYFHNKTGLGNYSRTLVDGLIEFYPAHRYVLFNPKKSTAFKKPDNPNVQEVLPQRLLSKTLPALWRSGWVTKDFQKLTIDLYHGLSHEIPVGIDKTGVKAVVTIHDLIFERYPHQFNKIDVAFYRRKFKYACAHADRIIAISTQTKEDLINLYNVDEQKIDICYQSCHPAFAKAISDEKKEQLRHLLDLPRKFFLYVGSVIERKNLLTICKALLLLQGELNVPLVVVGDGKTYKENVKRFLRQNGMQQNVIFLSEHPNVGAALQQPEALASIYKMAEALLYPSVYEGFGIPILEALHSGLPVITSNSSCLPETGGDATLYIEAMNSAELATAMKRIYSDEALRNNLVTKGYVQAQKFTIEKCTSAVMDVYKKLIA